MALTRGHDHLSADPAARATRPLLRPGSSTASPRTVLRVLGLEQLARLGLCGLRIAVDWFKWRCASIRVDARATARARRQAFRERTAGHLVATLGALKGAYVKAGQFAAIRPDLLPDAITRPLATLRDRVPALPYADIRRAVENELGGSIETHFAEFDREPLGAASIAQVHRARLHSGEEVAVKVQYPWLAASLGTDLRIVRILVALGLRLSKRQGSRSGGLGGVGESGRQNRRRFLDEFESGLAEELDFGREAAVAREIAANLAGDPQIRVPKVYATHSTRRLLTTSYQRAVRIDDSAALARLGVSPRAILEVVARAYAKQVFVDGLFHADPHPGNLFVLENSDATSLPIVLFVDFGLSRRLHPGLRAELRNAAHAIVLRDVDAFTGALDRLGAIAPGAIKGVRSATARMLQELASRGGALALADDQVLPLKDIAKSLLRETAGLELPVDLLLYAKTLSYVFALGAALDPDVDLMKLSLPYLLKFLGNKGNRLEG